MMSQTYTVDYLTVVQCIGSISQYVDRQLGANTCPIPQYGTKKSTTQPK